MCITMLSAKSGEKKPSMEWNWKTSLIKIRFWQDEEAPMGQVLTES